MKGKKLKLILIIIGIFLSTLSVNATNMKENKNMKKIGENQSTVSKTEKTELKLSNKTEKGYDLNFDIKNYEIKMVVVNEKTVTYRAYENIVYVKNPVDINYQTVNIYIPEEYFNGKTVGKYNGKNAPIFLPNTVGGYMPGAAGKPEVDKRKGTDNAVVVALSKGYVVASPGARGRTLKDSDGKYSGKAPAAIVDLKAAVRYLHYNDKVMPGNANKIISNGTSAGGALSVLLGATGNSKDYEPYLKELGAAEAKDDIFAVSAYCPITNLDNANTAYEWTFNGVNDYKKIEISMLDYNVQRKEIAGTLTEAEIERSAVLKKMFPEYLNSLKLKDKNGKILSLDKDGNGSFKEKIKKYYIDSANKALKQENNLSKFTFLTIKDNKVTDLNFEEYVKYMGRLKTPGAFDNVDLKTGENNLFGDTGTDNKHFTQYIFENSIVGGKMADKNVVKMMNPMDYIGKKGVNTSKYWRIRHGAVDKDTALAIPAILAIKLENSGKNVDFASPWGVSHSGDYDLDELFEWIEKIIQ
ncbi:alpha/beta hydrolase [Leptotrichia sp. OH3620_COT-345]|uniref:subtype B tannase n=1 Tax=Leptotrichia sp. OH3620_COT-345 TaxID=2491048 RepID=UPI000F64EC78|nr:subtype B tannase [Leptotrichia sp. OH3620_COT-345]RRD38753.1 alpha/beta hydrolase [Leptotrichia sp. OH3620_COT-345]